MKGHIALSVDGYTYREYTLYDPMRWQSSSANPFAGRVSTGGPYSLLDTFNDWTLKDWRSGVGHNDPDEGHLFSVADTRFPSQIMLPLGWTLLNTQLGAANATVTGTDYDNIAFDANNTSGGYGDQEEFAASMVATATSLNGVWVYIAAPFGTTVAARLYANSGNRPTGSALATATATSKQYRPHAHWMYIALTKTGLTNGATYHVSISHDFTNPEAANQYSPRCRIPAVKATLKGSYRAEPGGTWYATTNAGWEIAPRVIARWGSRRDIVDLVSTGTYMFVQDTYDLGKWNGTEIEAVASSPTISDIAGVGGKLWVALGSSYATYEVGVGISPAAGEARLFAIAGGYVWRAGDTEVWYSADGTTWEGPLTVATLGNQIRGMAALGSALYVSCDDGLYWIAPGDFVTPVVQWPQNSSTNGVGMCQWEGALYIPLYNGIMRYGADGSLLAVGPGQASALPPEVSGRVMHLLPTPHFLLATIANPNADGYSSLWAYNVDGWHCLSIGLQGVTMRAACINPADNHLYWAGDSGLMFKTYYPPNVRNPALDLASMTFEQEGWLEYDKFIGGYWNLSKDFESIFIDRLEDALYGGANPQRRGRVQVYVQVSTLGETWYHTNNSNRGTTAMFTFAQDFRPTGTWLRLGILLKAQNRTETPIVRGLSLRYSTMLADRWRWVLPVLVSTSQEMLDGTLNTYTVAQQVAHLDSLIGSVNPVYLRDIDGTTYRTKVTGVSRSVLRYEYDVPAATPNIKMIYNLTLEEMA